MFKFVICVLSFVILSSGCATMRESAKGFLGVSTKALEDNRKSAIVKTVSLDYFTAYTKTTEVLKQIGSYVYAQGIDKHMIAIYVSDKDTTPVGIFFKEMGASSTQIEVSSPSTYAKESIAEKLFAALVSE